MFGDRPLKYPQKISFLLVPGFSLFGLTSMLDPLRHANLASEYEALYQWELISEYGGLIRSSDTIEIMSNASLREVDQCATLIICAGYSPHEQITPALISFIRKQASHGTDIGCQDTATYIAAAAGILDGYRATIHWENLQSTAETYPNVQLVQELLVIDRKRFSCPGALSGLDMMLHLITTQHGRGLATEVADELVYTHKREHADPQRISLQQRLECRNTNLVNAVHLMERNIEEPLRIPELAEHVGISDRELERLFQHYLQKTPSAFYRKIRLDQARWMLQQSTDSVTSISVACGFASLSHFTRCYQRRFNKKPSKER
ncbi:GlxA family transcriptional regulator [Neptunomonas antarctica]|uniref:AraC family transcriptional regulator, carnitine catabolism transcriptional activator n=1 Tax=Neptunomonas antarctica TaxID=619304 RepID=A0A1N7L6C3_9GAMM|nr:GlxA family transcriptional regulator [Neptunomonas antarctica]SIS69341.1 AraC family transcriptional regulator, carnitine catabolism transcriptional activator [Neptunomonas antarctica]